MFFKRKSKDIIFHGHNLTKDWDYLGKTVLTYHDNKKVVTRTSHPVYFFVRKNKNREVRSIYFDDGGFEYHSFNDVLEEWKSNLKKLYAPISEPSDYLIEYMKTQGYIWSETKKWWISADSENEVKNIEDNVITVDFKKKT